MKKLGVVFAIIAIVALAGCATATSSKKMSEKPFSVDVSKLSLTKNAKVFSKEYDDLLIPLPEFSDVDFTKYRRVTVQVKFFNRNNVEVDPSWNANAMVSLVYNKDVEDKDLRSGPNVPFKTVNLGMEKISTEEGAVIILSKAPAAILLQNSSIDIGYVQLTALIFHNGNLTPAAETAGAGTLEPFSLVLADNFLYGEGYQGKVTSANMLGGHKIVAGETYTLNITFTVSRDLENPLNIGFVDTTQAANYWKTLSWDAKISELSPLVISTPKAGQPISATLTLNTVADATGTNANANALIFETKGEGKRGSAGSGVKKAVTLDFTQFVLTKQ